MEKFEDIIEELFDKPCWVIDVLPKRVPVGSGGRFFAVERYLLEHPQIDIIFAKFTNILLKLNCYYDIQASEGGEPTVNPDPETLTDMMARCVGTGYVNLLIPSEKSLIAVNGDDFYMTVYNPTEGLLELLKPLASSEGLFLRKSDQK